MGRGVNEGVNGSVDGSGARMVAAISTHLHSKGEVEIALLDVESVHAQLRLLPRREEVAAKRHVESDPIEQRLDDDAIAQRAEYRHDN